MEQLATLEIQNTTFKVTVGYMLNGKVNIIYKKVFPLSVSIYDCDIYDFNTLAKDLSVLQHIEENGLSIAINEVILIYPPYGLDVYTSSATINVSSLDSRISLLDIQNCLSHITREKLPDPNSVLVDVIPTVFQLDNRKNYNEPPINEVSTTLSIKANMYTLPYKMVEDLKKALKLAKIKVKKEVVAPSGVSYLINTLEQRKPNYFLINFGEKITTVSIVSDNNVVASTYFPYGKEHLLDRIVSNFEISYNEANTLLTIYGIDERQSSYHPYIYKYKDKPNKGFNKNELQLVVIPFFNEWMEYVKNAIKSLLPNENLIHTVGLTFTGEGALIKGLIDFVKKNYTNNFDIKILKTDVIGCEDPMWANSVGAICFSASYKGSLNDNNLHRINEISRISNDKPNKYTEINDYL